MKLLIIFIVLNVVNVILQTVKNIITIKCGKTVSALVNAVAFGLYTIVTVYTMCDLPLMAKALVVAICNLIGVWVVKYIEEKIRKDKLWEVRATVKASDTASVDIALTAINIPHNYIKAGKWTIFNCYCNTQNESRALKKALDTIDGVKYFVSESKTLA